MHDEQNGKSHLVVTKSHLVGIGLIVVIVFGLIVDSTRADSSNFYTDIIRLDNVATKIHQNYVQEIKSKDLIDNAIKGMLEILDPHSVFFNPKDYEELMIKTEGKFGGTGMQISIRDSMLTVVTPISGTPADRAGIQSGDQIIRIDGKSTEGLTVEEAAAKLRGEPGTEVSISIQRKGEAKTLDYTLTREIITLKAVEYSGMIKDQIGYIKLVDFSKETGDEMEKAIKILMGQNMKGLILDLRGNPGGLLPEAIEVAEKFLDKKSLVVSTRGRVTVQNKDFFATSNPVLPKEIPLVVLVNRGSASASEIVAGAIQDWDRGAVLGDTTFGKGSVQTVIPLDNENHLKLTTAFYYTPSGRCINKAENGIRGVNNGVTGSEERVGPTGSGVGKETTKDSAEKGTLVKGKKSALQDTTVYKTKGGRIVYGSGGIVPDSVIETEIGSLVVRALESRAMFFKFANMKFPLLQKKNITIDSSFVPDKKLIEDFYAYLDSAHFDFKSYASVKFDEFKDIAGLIRDTTKRDSIQKAFARPGWQEKELLELKKIATQVEELLRKEQKREFVNAESEIKVALQQAFLTREFGSYSPVVLRYKTVSDKQIHTALTLLSDKKAYNNLLQSDRKSIK